MKHEQKMLKSRPVAASNVTGHRKMKRRIEFEVQQSVQEVTGLVKVYFLDQGFRLNYEANDRLVFSRGNIIQNMITFNPLKWKSEIVIILMGGAKTAIQCDFDINTSGQAVTLKEEKLWNSFIKNFESAVKTGKDFTDLNKAILRETKRNAWVYIKWAVIGALVTGIPLGFIAYWTGLDSIVPVGAAGGAIAFMMSKINQDRNTGL